MHQKLRVRPKCLILTGPPGSGKSTIYEDFYHHLPVVDIDNIQAPDLRARRKIRKRHIEELRNDDFVFCTAAPTRQQKDYWFQHIGKTHQITLVALTPPMLLCAQRMKTRGHHERLQKGIQLWYKRYQPHRREWRVDGPDTRATYARLVFGHGPDHSP